jgi:hypothetical protein
VTYVSKGKHGKLVPKTFLEIPLEAIPALREGLFKLETALSGKPYQTDLDALEN